MRLPGLGPDSRLARWVGRAGGGLFTPRGLRIATLVAGLMLGFGLIAIIFMVQASSTPTFCGTCHIMNPYYESWKTSSHKNIACVECHIAPGVTAEIRKKWEALSMVARYFTGTYGTNPWAEIDDSACLNCHERRLLAGRELFGDVLFDHSAHLVGMRNGKTLRCTSCHSQIVQGSHMTVTTSTCILCHFKDQASGTGTARCTLDPVIPMLWKASMMPQTVPNNPMNGVMFPVVARKIKDRSKPETSRRLACRRVRESRASKSSGGRSMGFIAASAPG